MALPPGTRLGPYEVTAQLGVGGMGEVYRATDTNLKRQVAIKVLPEAVATDAERLARFQREAEVLAALNHPNIAGIYGLERADGQTALVMELVEGPTLADRIAGGPIPVDAALPIATQIAEALEAAHEQGIVHRDLKPANIKLRPDGTVKVLDFGLAKAMDPAGVTSASQSLSPTITTPAMTQAGMILGTAAYMAPEQARGVAVDKRADIWAFGCVLYEMLTGSAPFGGELVSDVLAAVLKTEPDYGGLPESTPASLRALVRRCLEKDPRRRYRDIGDVRYELDAPLVAGDGSAPARIEAGRFPWRWALTSAALAIVVVMLGVLLWRTPEPVQPTRLVEHVGGLARVDEGAQLALSRDGRQLAFGVERDGASELCVRDLAEWGLRCTSVPDGLQYESFSPNGTRVAFVTGTQAMKVLELASNRVSDITDVASGLGGAWHPDGERIIFNRRYTEGLWSIPIVGGQPVEMTTPDSDELGHFWPQVLADGNTVIFTRYGLPIDEHSSVSALRLDTGEIVMLKEGVLAGRYVETGHLLYVRFDTLFAAPFDVESLRVTGPEHVVVEDVVFENSDVSSQFDVSSTGTLAYMPVTARRELVWVDAEGREERVTGRLDSYDYAVVSPSSGDRIGGDQILFQVDRGLPQIWRHDVARDSQELLVAGDRSKLEPLWAPDGRAVVYQYENRVWDLHRLWLDDRRDELLLESAEDKHPTSFSPDGRYLVYTEDGLETGTDLWMLDLETMEPRLFLQTPSHDGGGAVSPDGTRIAYLSGREGRPEVYVQPFPEPGGSYRKVSVDGGSEPLWSLDGSTLYYRTGVSLMAVEFDSAGSPARPRALFPDVYERGQSARRGYDLGPDGRFLMVKMPDDQVPRQVNLVLNWFEELKRLVPVD